MDIDEQYMRRALDLARKGLGLASPGAMVGAVVVRGGEVLGEGFYTWEGLHHAEIQALESAGDRARGATLYLTLEPCAHHGRTPPCARAILEAGVGRIVVAMEDWRSCARLGCR
jgi:diaminohydroxyphosphoribosylaminopyrimidine deaminase/5-amino-6-(5-phosphoribosylamino)uracil reductase